MIRPLNRVRHVSRYREIITTFARYGFGDLIKPLGIFERLSLRGSEARGGKVRQRIADLSAPVRARMALEELGPTFIKFGQILSIRPDFIPPEYITELEKLQDQATPLEWAQVRQVLETELGDTLGNFFRFVESQPIGTASLAQVHAARLLDGTDVVIKIQRPEIERHIEIDLEIMRDIASIIQTVTPLDQFYDLPAIVDDFANTLRQELDYHLEADNAEAFHENFAKEKNIYIPRIYSQFTNRRILVMEHLRGIKIDDVDRLDDAGHDRRQIARTAAHLIVKEVLEDGFFHADPHPGNICVMPGGVLGVMDFGMVGWLDDRLKKLIAQLYVAVIRGDLEIMVNRLIQLHIAPPDVDRSRLSYDLSRLLRKYRGRRLKNVRAVDLLDDITVMAFQHKLSIPTELWLLLKTLSIMEGVGIRLDPEFNFFSESRPFITRLARQQWSASAIQSTVIQTSASLSELVSATPELVRTVEQGQLKIMIELTGQDELFKRIGRIINRLTTTLLLVAMILGISFLIPRLDGAPVWFVFVLMTMFLVAIGLSIWLAWITIRNR